jgi:hypothetical protein
MAHSGGPTLFVRSVSAGRLSGLSAVAPVAPQDSTIAVVGDGFGSLIVYATAVYLGFHPD